MGELTRENYPGTRGQMDAVRDNHQAAVSAELSALDSAVCALQSQVETVFDRFGCSLRETNPVACDELKEPSDGGSSALAAELLRQRLAVESCVRRLVDLVDRCEL